LGLNIHVPTLMSWVMAPNSTAAFHTLLLLCHVQCPLWVHLLLWSLAFLLLLLLLLLKRGEQARAARTRGSGLVSWLGFGWRQSKLLWGGWSPWFGGLLTHLWSAGGCCCGLPGCGVGIRLLELRLGELSVGGGGQLGLEQLLGILNSLLHK
jgi:hypothetical protein